MSSFRIYLRCRNNFIHGKPPTLTFASKRNKIKLSNTFRSKSCFFTDRKEKHIFGHLVSIIHFFLLHFDGNYDISKHDSPLGVVFRYRRSTVAYGYEIKSPPPPSRISYRPDFSYFNRGFLFVHAREKNNTRHTCFNNKMGKQKKKKIVKKTAKRTGGHVISHGDTRIQHKL